LPLRGLPVALIAATSVIPLFAAERPIEVGVPIKELISAMRNEDLDWDGTPAGIMPHVSGATTLFGRYGTAAIDLMFATPGRPRSVRLGAFSADLSCSGHERTPIFCGCASASLAKRWSASGASFVGASLSAVIDTPTKSIAAKKGFIGHAPHVSERDNAFQFEPGFTVLGHYGQVEVTVGSVAGLPWPGMTDPGLRRLTDFFPLPASL
jgi:hypothetical protein